MIIHPLVLATVVEILTTGVYDRSLLLIITCIDKVKVIMLIRVLMDDGIRSATFERLHGLGVTRAGAAQVCDREICQLPSFHHDT